MYFLQLSFELESQPDDGRKNTKQNWGGGICPLQIISHEQLPALTSFD